MPPVTIHSSSPINAAKAQGASPKTDKPEVPPAQGVPTYLKAQDHIPTSAQPYPPPQPGGRPAIPTQTSTTQASPPPPPTRTQNQYDTGPPPPQPGAVPAYPEKATGTWSPGPGQTYQPPQPTPAPTTSAPYPTQMSVPSPVTSYSTQIGSGTSTSTPHHARHAPVDLGRTSVDGYSQPPGYQQNLGASNYNNYQPTGYNSSMATAGRGDSTDDDDSIWGTAKKWAQTAGKNLAAAEQEVWRKINEK